MATKTFGLNSVVIDCTPSTTLEDFASALLIAQSPNINRSNSPHRSPRSDSYFSTRASSQQRGAITPLTTSQIANVVLAKNLNRAPIVVQIQALELLRTRRLFTRTSVQTAPKQFIFVPVLESASGGEARVTEHLNDFFYIAYWHDPEDGFVNLDGADGGDNAETASTESVVKKNITEEATQPVALILESVSNSDA